jgi:hypothetical protein
MRGRDVLCAVSAPQANTHTRMHAQTRQVVLACISRAEDGRYTLEDHSGHVPLDLKEAQTAAGFFTGARFLFHEGMNILLIGGGLAGFTGACLLE